MKTKALQHQDKRLSVSKVLQDGPGAIVGFYTLAMGQVLFQDLPVALSKGLPKLPVPIVLLAWLGVSEAHQGQGIGRWLLVRALREAYEAGRAVPFVAVVLDCVDDRAKSFYQQFQFLEMPNRPDRLYLSHQALEQMVEGPSTEAKNGLPN